MGRLVLGLDIGITSVGYGVIDIDNNVFVDYGVRLFKESDSENNVARRAHRGGRRLKRRRKNRLDDMKKLLFDAGILTKDYNPIKNIYEVRVKGLTEKLTNNELAAALLHITKNRGTTIEALESADADKEALGTKSVLAKNKEELREYEYICKVQLHRLKEYGNVRGTENNFKTIDYVKEARAILEYQGIDVELSDRILHIIQRRREYYEGPGSEKSPTKYGRWIEKGVEPIDLIEKMRGKCSIFHDELRAPKSSYSAELFNLLNDLNNISINGEKLTQEDKELVISEVNKIGEIKVNKLLKILNTKEEDVEGFRIDKNGKMLITDMKCYDQFKKIFDKNNEYAYRENKEIIDQIAEINTSKKGISERCEAIQKKFPAFDLNLVRDLAGMKGMTQYHSLSLKAIKIINDEMMKCPYNQMQVIHELGLQHYRKSYKGMKKIQADDEAILSPVAKRAQRETFKVINRLREIYGEFESIVVETTRDKNSAEKKKRIKNTQKYYEGRNKNVDKLLKEKGYDPALVNGKTKMKIKLYLDQDGKSAYTLVPLDLNLLISDPHAYEIDHIIPISISLDDSFNNKVLITHEENQIKGNRTPVFTYLNGLFKNCDLNTYKSAVKNNHNISRKKKHYMLYDKDITKYSNMKEFIARNLVDTSYANRVVLNTLTSYFKDNDISTNVHTIKGFATSLFRKRINLPKDREEDYLHHAIDALIIASVKKQPIFRDYLAKYNLDELYNKETGELIKVEDDDRVIDPVYIEFISNLKTIYEQSNQYYNGYISREEMKFKPIKISHKVDTKPNRQISDETIYSTRNVNGVERVVKKAKDIYDPKFAALTNDIINNQYHDKWIMAEKDEQTFEIIKSIVMEHFNTYKDDKDIYKSEVKKGVTVWSLKGSNNPLSHFKEEHGKVRKYSKKGNGPEITAMKYYEDELGNYVDITSKYNVHDKNVVLLQISPYRTDFYLSPKGKYVIVTIRYNNVFYKESVKKYVIDKDWYESEKKRKKIDESYQFVCSLHHDELLGVKLKDGKAYIYDQSTEGDGIKRHHHGQYEILKFTATNNDKNNRIEVKPIYTYCKKRCMPSCGTFIKLTKFATDVLGNLYEVKDNVLKLEFD